MAGQYQDRGFLDCLYSPLTLAPLTLGLTALIVAWVIPVRYKPHGLYSGVILLVISGGMLFSLWWFSGSDPRRAEMEKEFLDQFETTGGERMQSQPAEKRGTPARTEA